MSDDHSAGAERRAIQSVEAHVRSFVWRPDHPLLIDNPDALAVLDDGTIVAFFGLARRAFRSRVQFLAAAALTRRALPSRTTTVLVAGAPVPAYYQEQFDHVVTAGELRQRPQRSLAQMEDSGLRSPDAAIDTMKLDLGALVATSRALLATQAEGEGRSGTGIQAFDTLPANSWVPKSEAVTEIVPPAPAPDLLVADGMVVGALRAQTRNRSALSSLVSATFVDQGSP